MGTNLSAPPTAVMVESSNSRKAPVAWRETAHVLPILTTSGASPEVTAVWIRVWRSFQPMTSSVTSMPVSVLKASRMGVRASLSASTLEPWFEAQYVSDVEPPPEEDDPEQAVVVDTAARAAPRPQTPRNPRRGRVMIMVSSLKPCARRRSGHTAEALR